MKIFIIDPSFNQKLFEELITNLFPSLFDLERLVNKGCQNKRIPYQYSNLIIYPLTFEGYLKHINNIK